MVQFALDECRKHADWESAWTVCEKKCEHYNWVHAYPNAAAEVVATAKNVPLNEKWTAPVGDKLDTYMRDIKKLSIYELSKQTCELARVLNS